MQKQEAFPKPDAEVGVAETADQGAEAVEQGPAAELKALSTRLDDIVTENNNLEVAVGDTVREASFDYALDNPADVAADTRTILEALPKNDTEKAAALATLTQEASENAKNMSPEEAQGYVSKLCQEHLGGSLADVLSAAGDLVLPDTTILKKVMAGEMPKGRDVAKLASSAFAPPLGRIVFDMLWQTDNPTPTEIKQAVIKGKLGAHLIRLVGWVLPEAAVVTGRAANVMDSVNREVTKVAQQEGGSTAGDRAKAVGRGLTEDPKQMKALAEAMGVKMTNEIDLAAAGFNGDDAEFSKALGKMISENPDKAGQILHDMFRDDGGIVEQPAGRPDSAI